MVSQDTDGDSPSRRGVLRAGGVGLAGLLLAGCGSGRKSLKAQVDNSEPVLASDVEILNHLLDLEHWAIAAYTAATPLLTPATVKAGQLFLNDELSHAGGLAGLVRSAGGTPVMPRPSYPLGNPHGSVEVIGVLHGIEQALISAYLDAIPRLQPGMVKQQVASILANDAQHLAVVRAALHLPAVPSAYVSGRE